MISRGINLTEKSNSDHLWAKDWPVVNKHTFTGKTKKEEFLVCTLRNRHHVGVPLTKDLSLPYIVRDTNMAAISLSFHSLRNE
jgi:hypothetical protein